MDLLPVQCKVVDAESAAALLDKAKEAKATLTSVKTAKDKSIEACSFYFLDASVLRREGSTPIHRQCYQKIDESLISEREISMDKVITNLDEMGNTSAGSIPLALDQAVSIRPSSMPRPRRRRRRSAHRRR